MLNSHVMWPPPAQSECSPKRQIRPVTKISTVLGSTESPGVPGGARSGESDGKTHGKTHGFNGQTMLNHVKPC